MKIFVIVPYLTTIGGAARYAWELSEFLSDQGDNVYVISLYTDRSLYVENKVKIIDIADDSGLTQTIKFWINLSKIRKDIANLIRKEKPDVVLFNHFPSTLWAQKIDDIPILGYPQDINLLYTDTYINNLPTGKRWIWRILRYFVRIYDIKKWKSFDQIICNSKYSAKQISKVYGVTPIVIYQGTNTQIFSPKDVDKKRSILSMGDTYIRRADLLIKSARILKQKRDDFEIWIVGNKGELGKSLENLVQKLDLEQTVKFFGRVSDEKLAELYSQSLAVVHLVKEAPFGNIVTEAMSCGTPVISWKPGGPEESISHSEDGFLIPENDEQNLIKYIETFLNNPNLSIEMGKKARFKVLNYFDDVKCKNQIRTLMQEWLVKKSN